MKHSKRRQAVQHNQDISIPSERDKPLLSLDDSLDLFINYQHASNRSEATLKDYKTVVGLFLRYIAQNCQYGSVEQIVEADIVTWLSYLRHTPNKWGRAYSSRSIETYARDVAVFFRWLVQHNHLHVNPMLQVEKPKAEKVLIRVFVEDELKLLDAAKHMPVSLPSTHSRCINIPKGNGPRCATGVKRAGRVTRINQRQSRVLNTSGGACREARLAYDSKEG